MPDKKEKLILKYLCKVCTGKKTYLISPSDIAKQVCKKYVLSVSEIDEIMVMTVTPGAAGQKFDDSCLHKISALAATRKKYGLKYLISVDGGINADSAQKCWAAGADLLVSGSYLANSSDFPLAVQSLLKRKTEKSSL